MDAGLAICYLSRHHDDQTVGLDKDGDRSPRDFSYVCVIINCTYCNFTLMCSYVSWKQSYGRDCAHGKKELTIRGMFSNKHKTCALSHTYAGREVLVRYKTWWQFSSDTTQVRANNVSTKSYPQAALPASQHDEDSPSLSFAMSGAITISTSSA